MKSENGIQLLVDFINEHMSAVNPSTSNMMPMNNGDQVGITGYASNILDDEKQSLEKLSQEKQQAACCLIVSEDGYVLAVSRKDDPTAFGLPGGKVDPGETAEIAAARELQEETGLTASGLRPVFVRQDSDGFVTTTFACQVEGEIDTPESGVVRWVTPETLFAGPFGAYNRRLWSKLGLRTSVTHRR